MASIRKQLWSPNKENKAWVVDYKDQKGRRVLKTFPTQKEAEAWSVNALHEVQLGTHTPASASKTVAEVWHLWLEQCEADNLEFSTIRSRRQHLKVHAEPCIGHLRLSELTTPMLYDFDNNLRDKGRSIAIRRRIIGSLKTILNFVQRPRLGRSKRCVGCPHQVRQPRVLTRPPAGWRRFPDDGGIEFPHRKFYPTPPAVYRHRNLHRNAAQRIARFQVWKA